MPKEPKKCDPFNCSRFKKIYDRIWDKRPADVIVTTCPFRVDPGIVCNVKEGQNLMVGA